MNQLQLITLAFKFALLASFTSLLLWVVIYTILAKWWLNVIGRTLVLESILFAALLMPRTLSLFFHMNPFFIAWASVVPIILIAPVTLHRCWIWIKVYRGERRDQVAGEPGNPKRTEEASEWNHGDRASEV